MTCRKPVLGGLLCGLLLGVGVGCGGGGTQFESAGFPSLPADVEVHGNIKLADSDTDSVVVFGFVDLPLNANVSTEEPTSVGSIRPDGQFELSVTPGQRLTIAFLADASHDGVVDPGDPVATLVDRDVQLRDLVAGDSVDLQDVQISFGTGEAVPSAIEVLRTEIPEMEQPPTRVPPES